MRAGAGVAGGRGAAAGRASMCGGAVLTVRAVVSSLERRGMFLRKAT